MRYLFVINHAYLPKRVGGAESTIHELCVGLQRAGLPCAVLCKFRQKNIDPQPSVLVELRASIARRASALAQYSRDDVPGYPVYRYRQRHAPVRGVIKSFSPDVAIVHAGRPLGIVDALLRAGLPVILYVQDVEFDSFERDLEPAPGKYFMANSGFTAARLKERSGIDACVMPPLVDRTLYTVTSTRTKAVMVNPHPKKGVDITLQLARRRPDIQFDLFDAWPMPKSMRAELAAVANTLPNLAWRAHVLDPRRIYEHARVLVAPSRWQEAWGRVVTEAQLNGIPVLASNRGNLTETVGPGGITLDPDADISVWCEALGTLWDRAEIYHDYVKAALKHACRPCIQPEVIFSNFIRFVEACVRPN
ncbi:glycosyltransferase family 4 protein [soil metagenome]